MPLKLPSYVHFLKRTCSCWLVLCFSYHAYAQRDTSGFYYKLQRKADKHKVTSWLYDAIFVDVTEPSEQPLPKKKKKTAPPFAGLEKKIIRKIEIVSLDPFGHSVNDTLYRYPNKLEALGNKYHINTRKGILRNLLLFEEKEELDALKMTESERLLRTSPYVNDARIYVKKVKGDSVDVKVVVQDKWTTILGSNFDVNAPDIRIIERNIFGIGHQFEEGFIYDPTNNYLNTSGRYSIFNIKRTFITATGFYSTQINNKQFLASLDRPFYSPLAKWAGGIMAMRTYSVFPEAIVSTGELKNHNLNYDVHDVWGAKSFPLSSKKSASITRRSSNFVVGSRYYLTDFFERPSFGIDKNRLNRDQVTYLVNAGFSQRKYYRDRYLFRFGANEDIPEGFSCELVQGTMKKELSSRWFYTGAKISAGQHFDNIGYLSGGAGYGTFYNKTFAGNAVLAFDAFYFSDLIQSERWFFRQFTRYNIVHGIDREPYEAITVNGTQMYGFSSPVLSGKSKQVVNLEFVMYAPYKLLGFRFAPVLLCGFGTLGNTFPGVFNSRIYQSYALGLIIRNEYLITNTFEVSIGLYPYIPGSDVGFALNPVSSYTVRAKDYIISRPDLVPYQ